jgi:outer membrane receptor protein involved in Fe transport
LWKVNATARYEWIIGDFNAHLQGSLDHESGTWSDLRKYERALLGKNKAFTMADFTAGIDKDSWTLELYLKNAFDERAELGRYAECAPGTCGAEPYILPSQPRTIGLTFSQKFD